MIVNKISLKLWILAAIFICLSNLSNSPGFGFIMGTIWTVIVFETWRTHNDS